MSYLRELEEAYEKGWLLSTSELADRLGLSPRTIVSYGQEFEDAGKIFTRAGIRKGGEVAWAIDKIFFGTEEQQPSTRSLKQAFSSEFDADPD